MRVSFDCGLQQKVPVVEMDVVPREGDVVTINGQAYHVVSLAWFVSIDTALTGAETLVRVGLKR